jgi:hypothetical protein
MGRYAFYIAVFLLMGFTTQVHAQVRFTAKANKYEVGEQENFTIEFKVNANGSNFQPPNFEGFRVLGGPNTSQSSSFDSRNGRSTTLAYSYYLRPQSQGTFKIARASIQVNGQTYYTDPLEITVVEQAALPADPNDPKALAAAGAFFKPQLSKTSVYRGEPIVASYKLYFNLQIGQPQIAREPDFSGFYKEPVDLGNLVTVDERYGNANYKSAIVRQMVLIPQKTGPIKPGTVEMVIPTVVPVGGYDIFGRQRGRQINQELSEAFPTVEVKPLPTQNKPSDFGGAVGDYSFDVSLNKTRLRADESLSLKVSISGSGNIKLAELPKPELPVAFEAYDPKYEERIQVNAGGMNGSKSNEYLLIPRYGGTYKIPAMSFSFFNPDTRRYETITSEAFEVTVEGGTPMPAGGGVAAAEKEGVSFLGKDILTIKSGAELERANAPFFGSGLFYGLLSILLLLYLALIGLGVYLKNRTVDYVHEKQTKASKLARKHLAKAKKELDAQNKDGFYEALAAALWGYFADKLNIAPSKLSKENIAAKLSEKGVNNVLVEQAVDVLNRAEIARYTSATQLNPARDYEDTAVMITQIDRQL